MIKTVKSPNYNYLFNTHDGFFARWGKNTSEDPQFSPFGPEIADIEVSTICHQGCPWCYKANQGNGRNMSFATFKILLDKLRGNLTQVAFGIGDIDANPDLIRMMEYCRAIDIVPNITINGNRMTPELYASLARLCGAVSVSYYDNPEVCYNAVKRLSDAGLKQINIHSIISSETAEWIYRIASDCKTDDRLQGLNAVVLLAAKEKGRGSTLHRIPDSEWDHIVKNLFDQDVPFGMDSCQAHKLLKFAKGKKLEAAIQTVCEPCESGIFSAYFNVDGIFFPCSFLENKVEGIDATKKGDFLSDLWFCPDLEIFRKKLIDSGRMCPVYSI